MLFLGMGTGFRKTLWTITAMMLLSGCNGGRQIGVHDQQAEAVAVAAAAAVLTGVQMARKGSIDLRPVESDCTIYCFGCTYPCGDRCVPYATLCADPPGSACVGSVQTVSSRDDPPSLLGDCSGDYWRVVFP